MGSATPDLRREEAQKKDKAAWTSPPVLGEVSRRLGLSGAHQALAFSLSHPCPLGSKGEHIRPGPNSAAQTDVQPLPPPRPATPLPPGSENLLEEPYTERRGMCSGPPREWVTLRLEPTQAIRELSSPPAPA